MKWALGTLALVLIFVGSGVYMANQVWAPEEIEVFDDTAMPKENLSETTDEGETDEFQRQLEEEVRIEVGPGIESYQPDELLEIFPGLTESDFDGVKATAGKYLYEGGEVVHSIGESDFVGNAVHAVSNEGLKQLLNNAMERLGVNREVDKISDIMEKFRARSTLEVYEVDASDGRDWTECTPESKLAAICTMEYAPVCGLVEVQCVTEPCEPVLETFNNVCSACSRPNVVAHSPGECTI